MELPRFDLVSLLKIIQDRLHSAMCLDYIICTMVCLHPVLSATSKKNQKFVMPPSTVRENNILIKIDDLLPKSLANYKYFLLAKTSSFSNSTLHSQIDPLRLSAAWVQEWVVELRQEVITSDAREWVVSNAYNILR